VARRSAEHQQELKRRHRLTRHQLEPGRFRGADDRLRIHALVGRRARPASSGIEIDETQTALRLERSRDVAEHRHRIVHLVIRIDDQHGVDARRQSRVARRPEHGTHVLQPFALYAAPNRLDHLRLNVLGKDEPVRPDSVREVDREPPIPGGDIGNDGAFGDEQRIHDLIRLLP
jgi:hypothetical protein